MPGSTGARIVPCDRRTAADHALLAALRLHRAHAALGTSLGGRSENPPRRAPQTDHRRGAIPGLAGGSRLCAGQVRPPGRQPGPAAGPDRTEARPDRGPDLLGPGRERAASAAGSSPSREPFCSPTPGIGAPGSPSPRAAKPRWPATTSNPGATHSGAVPKTGWAATESSSRASEFPGVLSRYNQFFARYESIGTVQMLRRGVLFARSTFTAAPTRPGPSPSTAASESSLAARRSRPIPPNAERFNHSR